MRPVGVPLLFALAALAPAGRPGGEDAERVAILVPVETRASWRDDAFLAAVPAAAELGDGKPVALAVDASAPWRPELVDFLERYRPARILWVGEDVPPLPRDDLPAPERIACTSAAGAAAALARSAWPAAQDVVLFDPGDRGAALAAAALAARLGEPLFPCSGGALEPAVADALEALGATHALHVGGSQPRRDGLRVERLADAEAVVRWLAHHDHPILYLAAVNPREDAVGRDRSLALAAPLLAAARDGAVAPLPFATSWKARSDAPRELSETPPGAAPSSATRHAGEVASGDRPTAFVTGRDPTDGRWFLQLDRDGDGRFDGEGEQPVRTGESLTLGGRGWTADLDAEEPTKGEALWLTSPTAEDLRAGLDRYRLAAGGAPRFLALIGWPEALPTVVIGPGEGIDADVVSDLPLGETDPDPFVELALARFVAADVPSATLLACRGWARDVFPDQGWRGTFATAEWAAPRRAELEAAGLSFLGHHAGGAPIDASSPLTRAELILHDSHAAWTVLGTTYTWDSSVLLAPALVESSGCSTASLDQDPEHRSVAVRLLRNGAVAFVGNSRRGIAQGNLCRSELWNALLAGATLGEARRVAQNRALAAVLEKGETSGGPDFYALQGFTVYGDPALQLDLPRRGAALGARTEQKGTRVTVLAPERWQRSSFAPVADWSCSYPRLFTWSAAGVGIESSWCGPEKRNEDVPYVCVEARTTRRLTSVEPLDHPPAPLGWTGSCFVDEHADGSRTLLWRVRLLDADMTTGEVRASVDRLRFRLVAR